MQELLEYFVYNYRMENPILTEHLSTLFERMKNADDVPQDVKTEVFKAMQMSKGFTEYKAATVAADLGLTKSRIKALMKQAVDEGKVEMVVEYNLTFIKPIQLELNWVEDNSQDIVPETIAPVSPVDIVATLPIESIPETSNSEDVLVITDDDDDDEDIFIMVDDDDDEDIIIE
jgi:hypothetical protein